MSARLTPDEDNELRRLTALSRYGELSPAAAAALDELRRRDRRSTIRPPRDLVVPASRPADAPRTAAGLPAMRGSREDAGARG